MVKKVEPLVEAGNMWGHVQCGRGHACPTESKLSSGSTVACLLSSVGGLICHHGFPIYLTVLRTLQLSCAASHTSQGIQAWRGTTATTAGNCPAQLPHLFPWAPTGGRAGLTTSDARVFFSQTFLVPIACTGPTGGGFPFVEQKCFFEGLSFEVLRWLLPGFARVKRCMSSVTN